MGGILAELLLFLFLITSGIEFETGVAFVFCFFPRASFAPPWGVCIPPVSGKRRGGPWAVRICGRGGSPFFFFGGGGGGFRVVTWLPLVGSGVLFCPDYAFPGNPPALWAPKDAPDNLSAPARWLVS